MVSGDSNRMDNYSLSSLMAASEALIKVNDATEIDPFPQVDGSQVRNAMERLEPFRDGSYAAQGLDRSDYQESLGELVEQLPADYLESFDEDRESFEASEYIDSVERISEVYSDANMKEIRMSSEDIPHCDTLSNIGSLKETTILFGKKAHHDYHSSGEISEDSTYFVSGLCEEDLRNIGATPKDSDSYELGQTNLVFSEVDSGLDVIVDGEPSIYRMPRSLDVYSNYISDI